MLLVQTLIMISACYLPVTTLGADIKQLDMDHLMLLNVAVKGRLLSKLTEALTDTQKLRQNLSENVKECLVQVSAKHVFCRECVRDLCEKRTRQCNGDVQQVQKIMLQEERQPVPEVQMVKPDPVLSESVVELTNTAEQDILSDVPETLIEESKQIVEKEKTESKLKKLTRAIGNGFKNAINTIPRIIPKVKQAFNQMNTEFSDPETMDRLANDAAKQVAVAMEGKEHFEQEYNRNMDRINKQMPNVLNTVQSHMNTMMSRVGRFMNAVNSRVVELTGNTELGKIFDFPTNLDKKWSTSVVSLHIMKPNGEMSSWTKRQNNLNLPQVSVQQTNYQGNDAPREDTNQVAPRNTPNFQQSRFNGGGTQMQQPIRMNNFVSPVNFQANGRGRRSTLPTCEDIEKSPREACEVYHFRCPACVNDTVLLKHSCGKDALKTMVDIKMLDMKTAVLLTVYNKDMKHGLIVQKVEYDEKSFDQKNNIYRSAFITAKVGKKIITYETSALPGFGDIAASGGEIGEELWEILKQDGEFAPNQFVKEFNDNLHQPFYLKHRPSSSASVQSAVTSMVFSVVGFIFYVGIIVL